MGNAVIAVGIGGRFDTRPLGYRCYRNLRIGHGCPGRVCDSSENAAEDGLAGGWGRPEANGEREYCQGGQSD